MFGEGFNFEAKRCEDPREREVVRQELKEALDVASMTETRKTIIWKLIDELEEGAWQGGCREGIAYEQSFTQGEPE